MEAGSGSAGRDRPYALNRISFPQFYEMTTRLNDMDAYGHMNNAVFVEYFDSGVNRAMMERGALNMTSGDAIGLVVHGSYDYFGALTFPETIDVGLRVEAIGGSSITYGFAIFRREDARASAQGRFIHVYVDRATRRPAGLSPALRSAAETLISADAEAGT